MSKRIYSDEQRATALAALAANQGNLTKTAREMGIPRNTLENWSKGKCAKHITDLGEHKKKDLADCLEEVAYKLVDSIPKKISKASLQQVSVSVGIAVEKMRLLREQSTANNTHNIQTVSGVNEDVVLGRESLNGVASK